MKAALLYGPKDIRVEEVPAPEISEDEVLVRVKACGICAADLRLYMGIGGLWKPKYPITLGHEVSGVVEKAGSKVAQFKPGDRVAVDMLIRCGKCTYCLRGRDNLCENRKPLPGGFAEYTKAPPTNIFKIPNHLTFEEAALAEPLACCINSIQKLSIEDQSTVLIIGAGPMGLMHLQLLKALKKVKVIVSEILEERLKVAAKLGADQLINPTKQDLQEEVMKETKGNGVDAVIVAVGSKEAIQQAINVAAKTATIIIFGAIYPPTQITINPNILHYKEIILTGAHSRTLKQFQQAVNLLAQKQVNIKPIITHTYPLNQIKQAIQKALQKKALKIIIKP